MGVLLEVFLPLSLAFIMFSLGISLTIADFARVAKTPIGFSIGALAQVVLLPVIAFCLLMVFPLPPELALGVMRLYHTDMMSLSELIRRWTEAPAKLVKLDKGTLSVGADGDVTIFDPEEEWIYDRMDTPSKANNSPFHGWPLKGRNKATILMGKVVFEA